MHTEVAEGARLLNSRSILVYCHTNPASLCNCVHAISLSLSLSLSLALALSLYVTVVALLILYIIHVIELVTISIFVDDLAFFV